MDELLNKVFSSEVLTEDSKKELKEAFTQALAEATADARAKAEADIKAEIAEQFVADKEALVEAVDTKLNEALTRELEEMKEDVLRFRDLEVEYAGKLVEAREELANVVKNDMKELVEGLDAFLEARLTEEFAELKEDIEEQKKFKFGKQIFESFANEFKKKFLNEDDTLLALEESKAQLKETSDALAKIQDELKSVKREKEMTKVLESLTGRPREVMEVILKTVPTEKLSETYATFIGKVLHDATDVEGKKSEKESDSSAVLAESDTSKKETEILATTKVVTGDIQSLKEERASLEDKKPNLSEAARKQLRKLAGIE